MTIAQKMLDERRIGFLDGVEEGMEKGMAEGIKKGMEKGLNMAASALKGVVEPEVIAERFKMPLEQVLDILNRA